MTATPRQKELTRFYVDKGYHPKGSAAMVGNFSQEVGVDLPTKFTLVTDHGSQGLAQWRLDRLDKLEQFAEINHLPVTDLKTQALFVIDELESYPRYELLNHMLKEPGERSIANLTANFSQWFERPSKRYENLENRIRQASRCYDSLTIEPEKPAKDHVLPPAIGGAGGVVAIGTAWIYGPLAAIVVTMVVAAIILFAVGYAERKKMASVSPVGPATGKPAADELRRSLEAMKVVQQLVSAATAVYLLERQESDKLLAELKELGSEHNK